MVQKPARLPRLPFSERPSNSHGDIARFRRRPRSRANIVCGAWRALWKGQCLRETRWHEIQRWIQTLDILRATGTCEGPNFLKPYHFVTLALMLKEAHVGKLELPPNLDNYAARMRLWEAIGLESPSTVQANQPGSRFFELTRLVDLNAVEDVAIALTGLVTNNVGSACSEETSSALYTTLTELLGNCHHHARMDHDLHGLVCGQTWYRGQRAQFAIADSGIGIRASLAENPDLAGRLRTENACSLAMDLGVSSKLGHGHSGYGLTVARDLALQTPDSMLVVQSFDEAAVVYGQRIYEYSGLRQSLPGTLVAFEWNMKVPMDLGNVYGNWPKAEEDGDDFF